MEILIMKTFKDFIDDPREATTYGYEPCLLDCLSMWAGVFELLVFKKMWSEFKALADLSIRELPLELAKQILTFAFIVLLPFGGFFITGVLSYVLYFRPSVLRPRVAKRCKLMELDL